MMNDFVRAAQHNSESLKAEKSHASSASIASRDAEALRSSLATPDKAGISDKSTISVHKYVLPNGLTLLVRKVSTIPKVSCQLWYDVGSKHEKSKHGYSEYGMAHLIEHMIFKGTKKLSESDINVITHKLSGHCNAFTSYDYTGYLFDFPAQHWQMAFELMSECMRNASFKSDMLDSEMKAVIQELKMYKDHYVRTLFEEMISMMFPDHPYHRPVIGYKHDLWSVNSSDLHEFYLKHYVPNNATLIVVGDVSPEEVYTEAMQWFGGIPADADYKKEEFYHTPDLVSRSVTFYRDVKQPTALFAFRVPGLKSKQDHIFHLLSWILGHGKGSRLYQRLVNETKLATSVSAESDELFDTGIFAIICEPRSIDAIPKIQAIVEEELQKIAQNGVSDLELTRAIKQTQMTLYSLLEDLEHQAYEIGKYYLATNDENYLFDYLKQPLPVLKEEIKNAVREYFRASCIHVGAVLPMSEQDKSYWNELQKKSDELDEQILSKRNRTTPVEPPSYANKIEVRQPGVFNFPKPQEIILENGLKVLMSESKNTPKVDIILELQAKHFYDPSDKQGLYQFVCKMLMEGTKKHSHQELVDLIESRGMSFSATPGTLTLSLLAQDFELGLELLQEIVTQPLFPDSEIEKVRSQLIAKLQNFWDEPRSFGPQLIRERLYSGHPYAQNVLGTLASVKAITREELIKFHESCFSPHGARLIVVGDVDTHKASQVIKHALGGWSGPQIQKINFPKLSKMSSEQEIDHNINRDQVLLCYSCLSIPRLDPDYDKILLFDQIFGGGPLGSMASRLFELREQSGLFYTISGSLIAGSDEQPGLFGVRTIVSGDRLAEAEKVIRGTIREVIDTITQDDLDQAKRAIINSLIDNFSSNEKMAMAFSYLDRFNLPKDYFDKRALQINAITLEQVKEAARKIMLNPLLTLRVGRMDILEKCKKVIASQDIQ